MAPFAIRNKLNAFFLAAGLHEVQARQFAFAGPGGFDLTQWAPKKLKAYKEPRDGPPDYTIVHVTDVTNGFGVSKRRVQAILKQLDHAHAKVQGIPDHVVDLCWPGADELVVANRLALWERYKNLAYHTIGAGNGDVVANRKLSQVTFHGNWNRKSAGWALDVGHDQALDDFMVETGRASLTAHFHRVTTARVDAGVEPDHKVIPHRATSSGRRVDTDLWVWTKVVKPTVEKHPHVTIDYEFSLKAGRPVPNTWDPDALFDAKGRRL